MKVSVGYLAGFIGEGEITYAGPNALERAKLAGQIIEERLSNRLQELRIDYIGVSSAHRVLTGTLNIPNEVRLRVAGKAESSDEASVVGEEVEALYTNGPAGGGGARKYVNEVTGIVSTLIPRDKVNVNIIVKEFCSDENQTI